MHKSLLFCVENRKFSLPWQPEYVPAKCDWHSLIGRLRKPYRRTKNYDFILYTTGVMANFLVKFPIFRYHGNRGRLSKVWLTPLNWPMPITSKWLQASGAYLLHKLSYSQFCVENRKFPLPWQPGYVRAKCDWHSWIGRPQKPYHRTKNYDFILYTTKVKANFLVKFFIFCYHGNRGRLSKV